MVWFLLVHVLWVAAGVWSCGYEFAFFQREFPLLARDRFRSDRSWARECLFLGPIAMIVTIIMGHTEHGWFWPGRPIEDETGAVGTEPKAK